MISARFISFIEKGIHEGILDFKSSQKNAFVIRGLIVGAVMSFSCPEVTYNTVQAVDEVYEAMLKLLQ